MKVCPFCAEEIQDDAVKCKHCGSWLDGREQTSAISQPRTGKGMHPVVIVALIMGSILAAIVVVGILAAVAIPRFQGIADKVKIANSQTELAEIRVLLMMYRQANETSRYPETSMIQSHDDLVSVCAPYGPINSATDAAFQFQRYTSATADSFMLVVEAYDRKKTQLKLTPTSILP